MFKIVVFFIPILIILLFFEVIMRLFFKTTILKINKNDGYPFIIAAFVYCVSVLIGLASTSFNYFVFFYVVYTLCVSIITKKKIKNNKKRFIVNTVVLFVSGIIIFLIDYTIVLLNYK